jgi:nuclease-like protein
MSVYRLELEGVRLRVSVAGEPVGWVNVATGERHPEVPTLDSHLVRALADWHRERVPEAAVPAGASLDDRAASATQPRSSTPPRRDRPVTAEEYLARRRGAEPPSSAAPVPVAPARRRRANPGPAGTGGDLGEDLATRRPGAELERAAAQRRPHAVLYVLARVLRIRTEDWAWRVGAAGERAVGRRLDRLAGHGCRLLHSIPLGRGGDLDHLVIGPRGIAVVNTKHHKGATVTVGEWMVFVGRRRGYKTDYAEKSAREAARVRRALADAGLGHVPVRPVLVVHGAIRVHGWRKWRPGGVAVLPSSRAGRWLRSHRAGAELLSPEQVETLYERLRWASAWRRV